LGPSRCAGSFTKKARACESAATKFERYGLAPGPFRDLILGLARRELIAAQQPAPDGRNSFDRRVMGMFSDEFMHRFSAGAEAQAVITHAGRVHAWNLRDALLRDSRHGRDGPSKQGRMGSGSLPAPLVLRRRPTARDHLLRPRQLRPDQQDPNLGYPVGDDILRAAFALTNNLVGPSGQAYRYGGEEVGVLLPSMAPDGAHELAERLRAAFETDLVVRVPKLGRNQTASFGVAAFTENIDERQATKRVSAAANEAKRAGKNRVCRARE
jgi:diguanylate cyclase (GGDEF)-like protein